MNKEQLSKLSKEDLKKKEKGTKTMIGIFIPLVILLTYFGIRDYMNNEADWAVNTITICTFGGLVVVIQELRDIREALKNKA